MKLRGRLTWMALITALSLAALACSPSETTTTDPGATEEEPAEEEAAKTPEELAATFHVPIPEGVTLDAATENDDGTVDFQLTDSQAPRPDFYDQQMQNAGWEQQETRPINFGYRYQIMLMEDPEPYQGVLGYYEDGRIRLRVFKMADQAQEYYGTL